MFAEKLIDFLVGSWNRLSPLEIIEAYNRGVVLRFGKYNRTLEPGIWWKWPVVEDVVSVLSCVTTMPLPAQTLTTKDDIGVVVAAIVKYQIAKPEPYVTDIWDQRDVLQDVSMGAVQQAISSVDYALLVKSPPEEQILKAVRKETLRYGFDVLKVTFTDIGKVRSIRLIQAQRPDNESPHTNML